MLRKTLVSSLLLLALAAAPAAADAAPIGALGAGACVTQAGEPPCDRGRGLDGAASLAIAPDASHAYAASSVSDAVTAFGRGGSGRLEQLAGIQGCTSDSGSAGSCVDGGALNGAASVAVSPDGKHVYVAATLSDSVAAFARDAGGRLTQLAGIQGCVSETGSGGLCADGAGLDGAASVAVSPDGRHVYVASRLSDAVAVFARDASSGALVQPGGAGACISVTGAAGCTAGRALDGAGAVLLDPLGEHVYVASRVSDAVAAFSREPVTGALEQRPGTDGCVSVTGGSCATAAGLDGAAGLALEPDGRQLYVAAARSNAVTILARDRASGRLASLGCVSETPNDSGRATVGCSRSHTLRSAEGVALSPDGASVYVAAPGSDAVAAFSRNVLTGLITQLAGASGCITDTGAGGACGDGDALVDARVPVADPGGERIHVASSGSDGLSGLARNVEPDPPPSLSVPSAPAPEPPPAVGTSVPQVDDAPPPRRVRPASARTTFLLSRAADGGFPDGPSRNGVVSHDQRIARYMAYESDATNVVPGDVNGATDVFVVSRRGPWGRDGTPWEIGDTIIASQGMGGQPANGRSYRPALDGDSHHRPRCVAFISEATNLVPGDTNGVADAFVRYLRTGRIARVSVDSRGRQALGPTTEVAIDGACERIAFVADAPNLAMRRAGRPAWRSARTTRPRRGSRQVYVHVMRARGHDRGFRGMTFLASASGSGRAANGDAFEVAIARDGKSVAFASTATNLARGDRGRRPDVYKRAFSRRFRHLGRGRGMQTLRFATTLVSATRRGRAGNGDSGHPAIDDVGRFVAYETRASDLLPGDRNGVTDIVRSELGQGRRPLRRPRHRWVSMSAHVGRPGNGASSRPVISGAGEFVLFDSEATNLKPSASVRDDRNGVRDVFLWNAPTGNVSLESRDADNGYLETPSQAPSTSSRGNYAPFESANPLIDLPLAEVELPSLAENRALLDARLVPPLIDPAALAPSGEALAARARAPAGVLQQVYVRYLGPK